MFPAEKGKWRELRLAISWAEVNGISTRICCDSRCECAYVCTVNTNKNVPDSYAEKRLQNTKWAFSSEPNLDFSFSLFLFLLALTAKIAKTINRLSLPTGVSSRTDPRFGRSAKYKFTLPGNIQLTDLIGRNENLLSYFMHVERRCRR